MAEAAEALGGLHVLVNNVGIARQAKFEEVVGRRVECVLAAERDELRAGVRAALRICARSRRRDRNVSSTAGKRPSPGCRTTR